MLSQATVIGKFYLCTKISHTFSFSYYGPPYYMGLEEMRTLRIGSSEVKSKRETDKIKGFRELCTKKIGCPYISQYF